MNSDGTWTASVGPRATSRDIFGCEIIIFCGSYAKFRSTTGQMTAMWWLIVPEYLWNRRNPLLPYGAKWNSDVSVGPKATSRGIFGCEIIIFCDSYAKFRPTTGQTTAMWWLITPKYFWKRRNLLFPYGGIWNLDVTGGLWATSRDILGVKLRLPVANKSIFFPSWARRRTYGDLLLPNTFGSGGICCFPMTAYGIWTLRVA